MGSLKKILLVAMVASVASALPLQQVIELTIANEPQLQSAQSRVESRQKGIDVAKADLYPQIWADVTHVERKYTSNPWGNVEREDYEGYTIHLHQPIYNRGISTSIKSANLEYQYEALAFDSQKNQLISKVAGIYLDALIFKSQLEKARVSLDYEAAVLQQYEALFEKKLAQQTQLQRARLNHHQASVAYLQMKNDLEIYMQRLSFFTGVEIKNLVEPQEFNQVIPNIEEIKLSNPTLLQAKKNIALQRSQIKRTQAQYYPDIKIRASHAEFNPRTDYSDLKRDRKVILELQIPIFSGFKTSSRVQQERLLAQAALHEYDSQENDIVNQYSELYLRLELSNQKLSSLQEAVTMARQLYQSSWQAYYEGKISTVEFHETRNILASAEHDYNYAYYENINISLQLSLLANEFSL